MFVTNKVIYLWNSKKYSITTDIYNLASITAKTFQPAPEVHRADKTFSRFNIVRVSAKVHRIMLNHGVLLYLI